MKKACFHPHSILFPVLFCVVMIFTSFSSLPVASNAANAAEVSLAWDANSEQDLAGYKLYYKMGTDSGAYNGTGANEGSSPLVVYLKDLINSNSPTYLLTGLGDGSVYSFAVTAFTDGGMESDFSNQVSITTELPVVNQMPNAEAGADQTVTEGETVYLNGTGSSDLEGSISGYFWRQVSGPIVVLTNAETVQASFVTPDVGTNGVALSFELQVTDAGGLSDTDSCTVNVTWLNEAPTAYAGADRSAIPNEIVTLDGSQSKDPDGGVITYEWSQTQGPTVSISNFALPSPTFKVPELTAAGTSFVFELTVTDTGGLMSTDECVISTTSPISIDPATEPQSETGKTDETPDTSAVTEPILSADSINEAPVASAGPDRTAIPNEIVTLDGSESYDANDLIATYQWSQKQGPAVNLVKASTENPKFRVPKSATEGTIFVFELAVTDASGLTSKDVCNVEIAKSFSIASATEIQGVTSDVDTQTSEVSTEEKDSIPDEVSDQTEADASSEDSNVTGQAKITTTDTVSEDSDLADQTKTAAADTDPEADVQDSSNRAPEYPVPVVAVGDDPLLIPVELAVKGFTDPDTGDTHSKTQWQVYRTADKVCVLNTFTSSCLTDFRIPEIILDENTAYFWRARFFDNHGAASEWSRNVSFKTDFSETDIDGNGVPDDQEVGISVDMNSDEMPDAQQAVVKSIMIPSCNEPIGLSIENANTVTAILSMSAVDAVEYDFAPEDEEMIKQLPYGLINFKLAVDQPGDTAVVTVHFSQPVSSGAKWIKFDPVQGIWLDYSAYAEFSDDGESVNLEFVDGGFGDDDGVANGIIVDPSGLDLSPEAESFTMEAAENVDMGVTDGDENRANDVGVGCFVSGAMEETIAGFPLNAACVILLLGAALVLRLGDRKLI